VELLQPFRIQQAQPQSIEGKRTRTTMNFFDLGIIHFVNSFAHRSKGFDSLMVHMSENVLLEGGLIVVLFWWVWSQGNGDDSKRRGLLVFGIFTTAFAVMFARFLALTLPFRLRPIHDPSVAFKLPYFMDPGMLLGWSSFPSDHSVVFFCLAMTLWFASKRVGAIALTYALLGSSLPRIYLGIHYPTDVLSGAALGIAIAYLAKVDWIREAVLRPVLYWQEHHAQSFSAFLFLCTFEIAEEFNSARMLALSGFHGVETILQALR
jgi:undecaprenyl-diphosphatase